MCPAVVAEAFHVASSGRPGPVLIDLPKDVAAGVATRIKAWNAPNWDGDPEDTNALIHAGALIEAAERPLLYIGGGVTLAGATSALRAFARRTGIPAVATLKGLGTLPTDAPQFLGMLGMASTAPAPPTWRCRNATC